MAHSAHLVGAGLVVKFIGKVAERLFENNPVFAETEHINFVTAGSHISLAGFKILAAEEFPNRILDNYSVDTHGQLVSGDGSAYNGSIPYVCISLDGSEREELEDFEATQATAALLSDYFAIREGQQTHLDVLLDGLKLYNDLKFRKKADAIMERMKQIGDTEDAEYKKLREQYDALVKNIKEEVLIPDESND
tara:strand:+ start:192 stop:770 length:579 start_codon:yes stop_codon:yes gene_type:complete